MIGIRYNHPDLVSSDGLDFDYDSSRATESMRMASGQSTYDAFYAGRNQFERVELEGDDFVDTVLGTSYRDEGGQDAQAYRRSPDGNFVGVVESDNQSDDRHYYLTDAQGTVAAVTDGNGKVTNRYEYSPYGETSDVSGAAESGATAISQPYRYTGQYQDPTGLYKMGIRYYHPELARWTQQDPAYNRTNLPAGNLYAYVGCNPANYTDPSGAAMTGWEDNMYDLSPAGLEACIFWTALFGLVIGAGIGIWSAGYFATSHTAAWGGAAAGTAANIGFDILCL